MPASLVIELAGEKEKRHGYFLGSLLQGALMELLDPDYAAKLHYNNLHPYSQFVTFEKDILQWHVQMLDLESRRQISDILLDDQFEQIYLEHREETLKVIQRNFWEISEKKLLEAYYFGECSSVLKLRFLTPTSFKQNGKYMIYPTVRLIFQSLMRRYDISSKKNQIFSDELLEEFEKRISIIGYRLRSTAYYTDHVKIPSFMGDIILRISGPQQLKNLAWFLAKFGEYSGVGIKTGIGMGGLQVIEQKNGKEEVK